MKQFFLIGLIVAAFSLSMGCNLPFEEPLLSLDDINLMVMEMDSTDRLEIKISRLTSEAFDHLSEFIDFTDELDVLIIEGKEYSIEETHSIQDDHHLMDEPSSRSTPAQGTSHNHTGSSSYSGQHDNCPNTPWIYVSQSYLGTIEVTFHSGSYDASGYYYYYNCWSKVNLGLACTAKRRLYVEKHHNVRYIANLQATWIIA